MRLCYKYTLMWLQKLFIHALEKSFMLVFQLSYFLQALHNSVSTTVLFPLLTSQRIHESMLWSYLNCNLHLLKVVTGTFLILELVGELLAVLFWLDVARSCSLGITSFSYNVQMVPHASVYVCFASDQLIIIQGCKVRITNRVRIPSNCVELMF